MDNFPPAGQQSGLNSGQQQLSQQQRYHSDNDIAQAIGSNAASFENQTLLEQTRAKRFKLCQKMLTAIGGKSAHLISDLKKLHINLGETRKVNGELFEAAKLRLADQVKNINTNSNNSFNKYKRNYDSFITNRRQQLTMTSSVIPLISSSREKLTTMVQVEQACGQYMIELNTILKKCQQLTLEVNSGELDQGNITQMIDSLDHETSQLDKIYQSKQNQLNHILQPQVDQLRSTFEQLKSNLDEAKERRSTLMEQLYQEPGSHALNYLIANENRLENVGNLDHILSTLNGCMTSGTVQVLYQLSDVDVDAGGIDQAQINEQFQATIRSMSCSIHQLDIDTKRIITRIQSILANLELDLRHTEQQCARCNDQLVTNQQRTDQITENIKGKESSHTQQSQIESNLAIKSTQLNQLLTPTFDELHLVTCQLAAITNEYQPQLSQQLTSQTNSNQTVLNDIVTIKEQFQQQLQALRGQTDLFTGYLTRLKELIQHGSSPEFVHLDSADDIQTNNRAQQLQNQMKSDHIAYTTTQEQLSEALKNNGQHDQEDESDPDLDPLFGPLQIQLLDLQTQHPLDLGKQSNTMSILEESRTSALEPITSKQEQFKTIISMTETQLATLIDGGGDDNTDPQSRRDAISSLMEKLLIEAGLELPQEGFQQDLIPA